MQVLGMFIGASFAEISVIDSEKKQKVFFQRWYLPRLGIRNQLQKILIANPHLQPKSAFICSRFLEKIFDYRLGGSVAQLVTSGLEHWPYLSQAPKHQNIFNAERTQPISSPELTFAIQERVSSKGEILKPIQIEELKIIHEKLKLMEVKKICLHFLHANKNPKHEEQAKNYFEELGYEVFAPHHEHEDEGAIWRENTLNAAVTGTFSELRKEIEEGLSSIVSSDQIYFIDNNGVPFINNSSKRIGTLFSIESIWKNENKNYDILDLGLEKFTFTQTELNSKIWNSPWGPVALSHPSRVDLLLQPSSSIKIENSNELSFSKNAEGFEPGPMSFGRGQKPLFFDLFLDEISGLCETLKENIHPQGAQRFQSSLRANGRMTRDQKHMTPDEQVLFLKKQATDLIVQQVHFLSQKKPILLTGFFAPIFIEQIKQKLPHLEIEYSLEKLPLKSEQIALQYLDFGINKNKDLQ